MADVPIQPPPYEPQQVNHHWWYCLHCRKAEVTEYTMKTHVKAHHFGGDTERQPDMGEDYTNGSHLRIIMERWEKYSLLAVDHFITQLDSLRGADDFAFEVGEGVQDA